MKVWPGDAAFPDFFRSAVREWWGEWHRFYLDAGIAGIWNDMNEPSGFGRCLYLEDAMLPVRPAKLGDVVHRLHDGRSVPHAEVHNAYGHEHTRATYEGMLRLRPGERPFVLTRAAFAGTQRYAAQWTGDVVSNWAALRQSIPMLLGMGLSGVAFAGTDIGGFAGDATPELYARWMQIGALAPFCRSHTSIHTHRQEPWSFGPRVEAISRAASSPLGPAIVEMRRSAAAGELGRLLQVEGNFSQDKFLGLPEGNWRLSEREAPAGPMTATGVHLLDLAVSFFLDPPIAS